jgi:uroporphyrinogen decarboxylase-like protein
VTEKLTNRERFCRLYDFEKVDRPTRWEAIGFWGQTVDAWKASGGLPADADVMEHYGLEPWPVVGGGLGTTTMSLSGPPVEARVVKEEGATHFWEDDLGKVWRTRCDGGESMPQWLRFPVESPADWTEKVKPRLDPSAHDYGDLEERAEEFRGREDPVLFFAVGLYAFWRNFIGEVNLAYAFYDEPDMLHDMARKWLEMHCCCSPRIFETAHVDYVCYHEDMAFKNGPLIGPKLFDEFMAPYYRELIPLVRRLGQKRIMLDSDGNNGPLLRRFADLGFNGMYPFEVAAGYDIRTVRAEFPDFFIWGGIDKRVLLAGKEAIEREVMEKVPPVWESGGFIPSVDHTVPPCPQENFEYFLELLRGLFE